MVDPLYNRLYETARRLIEKYGKPAQGAREVQSGPPNDPVFATVTYDMQLVETKYSITDRNETLIHVGDKLGVISPEVEMVPEKGDAITLGGLTYYFVDLQPLNPGGLTVIYDFQARR